MLTAAFGRDERPFRLCTPQWCAVEKTCDAGLVVIAARLAPLVNLRLSFERASDIPGGLIAAIAAGHFGSWRLDDVREPILQGLIGGGMTSTEAGALVRHVFDESLAQGRGPAFEWAMLAWDILQQAIIGLPDEPLGEKTAAEKEPGPRRRSRTARPASQTSTPPAPG